jgi:polyhydroxybutyrate depolymerase
MKQLFSLRLLCVLGAVSLMGAALVLNQAKTAWPPSVQGELTGVGMAEASPPPFAIDVSGTLTDQGQTRTYQLHTPAADAPNHALPLIVALHGSGMQGQEMADKTALSKLADQAGFVIVYPDGLKKKWNVSGKSAEDNVAFVHALINQVQHDRTIDPQRIYVVGLSNGGILAQKLACEAPDQIAAIATVAASLPTQFSAHCQTQKPIAILMVNGTDDTVVPWEGGASPAVHIGRNLSVPSIPGVIDFWQQHNVCQSPAQVKSLSDRVEVTDYLSCQSEAEVMLVALKGAGHIWSGGGYGQSAYGDTTDRVWQFLQRHSLRT